MKKIKWPVMALVVGCLVTYACQKSKETKSEPAAVQPLQKAVASAEILTPQSVFTKNVGRPVPRDTCMMWIGQYEKSSLAATGTRCSFKASDLAALLKYKDVVGITFYNGYDKEKGMVLMPLAVNTSGSVVKTAFVNTSIGAVTWQKSAELKANYKILAASGLEAEYFGANTFERLITLGKATTILIRKGMNEKGECLILSNADQPNTITYEEDGTHCPPFCVGGPGTN